MSGDFATLLRGVKAGRAPFESILEHAEFMKRARSICRRICRGGPEPVYDADDLFADACGRVLEHKRSFVRRGTLPPPQGPTSKTPEEDDFFRWFYVVARNTYLSRLRKSRFGVNGPHVVFVSLEECRSIEEPGANLERENLLRDFREFMDKNLPTKDRLALELWVRGFTLREIAQTLDGEGVKCSHVSVRKWIQTGLKAFMKIIDQSAGNS
jgi:RNA polymerase sigma factor (sigma-70 family)